jgi:hypothetical protein
LDEEQLQFWKEPVSLAEEIAIEERHQLLVPERTTAAADTGNVRVSRHEEEDRDGGIAAVAEAAVQHGAGKDLAAAFSQATVRGAEQACTAIAVLACKQWLSSATAPLDLASCIYAGAELSAKWGRPDGQGYANAAEMVQLASGIRVGDEYAGRMQQLAMDGNFLAMPLRQALTQLLPEGTVAVLTCGVFSVALRFAERQYDLFDSHFPAAVLLQFASLDALGRHLVYERFPEPSTRYSLCVVEPSDDDHQALPPRLGPPFVAQLGVVVIQRPKRMCPAPHFDS